MVNDFSSASVDTSRIALAQKATGTVME